MNHDDPSPRLVVLTAGGANPQVVINALAKHWPDLQVIEEQPEPKSVVLKRRARRLGWLVALGQMATMVASRLGKNVAARRSQDILESYGYSAAQDPALTVHRVTSLNDPQCHALLARLAPNILLTVSCRLLSKATLAACPCPVINLHAGINPAYRGQMGGYWSLVESDRENFGATVHLVDAGTDTGGTLYEVRTEPTARDFISTYPLLLTAAAIEITVQAVSDGLAARLAPHQPSGRSALRFPPTLWAWLWNGITKRIW